MEGSVMKGLRDFRGSPRDSLTGRTSSCEKHLDKFFKIFVLSVLAIGPDDLLATWLSCENHVFCAYRSVFKCFQFSLEHFWLFIVFPISNLSKTYRVTLEELHFCKSPRKRCGFSILTLYFMFLVLFSWLCEMLLVFLSYMGFEHGFILLDWLKRF